MSPTQPLLWPSATLVPTNDCSSTHIRNTLPIAALVPVFRTDTSQILRQETHFSLFVVNGILLDSVLVHDTFLNVPRLCCEIQLHTSYLTSYWET